jgi:hypothetical protein
MSLKSKTFEKLSNAVDNADESTIEGVEILALAASAIRNLNEGTDLEEDIYKIGTPGEVGFGVATCPAELIPSGWRGLDGHDNIMSPNYGNYIDVNGSILVYIPKHYYKWDGNNLYISDRPLSGYVIDRAFINAGKEINGVFVYKYGGVNVNGIFASKQNLDPVSTYSGHNPVANINGCSENNYGELYQACKSAGSKYFLTSIFIYSMLARLAFAHGKAATNQVACAYSDVAPYMPKGNLNNALKDYNDPSVVFTPSGYSNCALTGSGVPFAKTTHNGQDSGVADLVGNMWEVASGFIRYDANGFMVLKESVDITAILNDDTTQGNGGAYDIDLYDVIDLSDLISGNDGWIYFGNGSNPVFGMSTDRTSSTYKRTALNIPLSIGVSGSGTTEFGNDGLYRYLLDQMACLCGASWSNSSNAGVFAMTLSYYRTHSSDSVGGRASYIV